MNNTVLGQAVQAKGEKVLCITPHLSTGGLPQYLAWYVERLLAGRDSVWVLEWNNIAPLYKVQKDKLRRLVGERLVVWEQGLGEGERFARLKALMREVEPEVVYLAEFPESFLPDEVVGFLYSADRDYKLLEATHDSKFLSQAKRTTPDELRLVSPAHVERFRELGVPMVLEEYTLAKHARPDRTAGLEALGLDPAKRHVLNVGLFAPGKNQGEVFEIARLLPEVEFHFVGNQAGNFADYWQPLMANKPTNCHIWGERSDADSFYACMDLLLFTSKHELLPLVPLEALSWDQPVMMRQLDIYKGRFDGEVEYIDEDVEKTAWKVKRHLGLSAMPKVKLVHMLTRPEDVREQASVESLQGVAELGVEYVQHINKPCEVYPTDIPAMQVHKELKPGYYGAYQSFRKAVETEFTPDVDVFIVCECDCVLEVSLVKFVSLIEQLWRENRQTRVDFFSFGHNQWSPRLANYGNFGYRTNKIIAAQCVGFVSENRKFLIEQLSILPWDVTDLWLDECFKDRVKVVLNDPIASQHEGFSLIDRIDKPSTGVKRSAKSITIDGELVELYRDDEQAFGFYDEVFECVVYKSGDCEIASGDVCVDLGAHIGMFSLYALSRGASRVVALEPTNGKVLETAHKNLDRFLDRVELVNKAVAGESGAQTLYRYADTGMSTTSDRMLARYGQYEERLDVDGISLEDLAQEHELDQIDFLKMDIEGSEYEVVLGTSREFFQQKVAKFVLEYHQHPGYTHSDLEDYFKSCGFALASRVTVNNPQGFGILYGVNKAFQRGAVSFDSQQEVTFAASYTDGPKLSVRGLSERQFDVEFRDADTKRTIYQTQIGVNHWAMPNRKWFTPWEVVVRQDGVELFRDVFDCTGKRVFIVFESKALGDTLAWFPYVEEFRKKHECQVVVSTFWNELFKPTYEELTFVEPGSTVSDLYAVYRLGCYDDDANKHKKDWRLVPLQQVGSDILGLDYVELRPRLSKPELPRHHDKDYVAISEFASNVKSKRWLRRNGWQDLVKVIKARGLDVMAVSKEQTKLQGVRRCTMKPIEETIRNLYYAKAFVGVGSGLAWLAWALGVPVVMVSGFSEKFFEMQESDKVSRISNESVCHGCFNDIEYVFDRGDANWCPRGNDYVCTKTIEVQDVLRGLERVI